MKADALEVAKHLIQLGYKTYRYSKKQYVSFDFNSTYLSANFNVMIDGGTGVFFVLNNDFENAKILRLNEKDKPAKFINYEN